MQRRVVRTTGQRSLWCRWFGCKPVHDRRGELLCCARRRCTISYVLAPILAVPRGRIRPSAKRTTGTRG